MSLYDPQRLHSSPKSCHDAEGVCAVFHDGSA